MIRNEKGIVMILATTTVEDVDRFLTVFGTGDPILGRADRPLQAHVPGATGQPHARIRAGHFIQEDQGPELATRTVDLIRATP